MGRSRLRESQRVTKDYPGKRREAEKWEWHGTRRKQRVRNRHVAPPAERALRADGGNFRGASGALLLARTDRGGRFGEPRLQRVARAIDRTGTSARTVHRTAVEQRALRSRFAWAGESCGLRVGGADRCVGVRADFLLGRVRIHRRRSAAGSVVPRAGDCDDRVRVDVPRGIHELLRGAGIRVRGGGAFLEGARNGLDRGDVARRSRVHRASTGSGLAGGNRGVRQSRGRLAGGLAPGAAGGGDGRGVRRAHFPDASFPDGCHGDGALLFLHRRGSDRAVQSALRLACRHHAGAGIGGVAVRNARRSRGTGNAMEGARAARVVVCIGICRGDLAERRVSAALRRARRFAGATTDIDYGRVGFVHRRMP